MEGNNGSKQKGERKAPQFTPDGPFSDGNQYKHVPLTELTVTSKNAHLRRMRNRSRFQNGQTADQIDHSDSPDLLPGDFALYEQALIDGLNIDPEGAAAMASAIRQRFEEGSPADRTRLASAVGTMFDALYPTRNGAETENV